MQHDRRVLSNGIKHHWILELGGYFTNNMDALRLKACEMSRNARAGFRFIPITIFVRAVWNFQFSHPRSKFTRLVARLEDKFAYYATHLCKWSYDFRRTLCPSSSSPLSRQFRRKEARPSLPAKDLAVLTGEIPKGRCSPFDLTFNVSHAH